MLEQLIRRQGMCTLVLGMTSAGCIATAFDEVSENSDENATEDVPVSAIPAELGEDGWRLTYNDEFDFLDLSKYETRYIWPRELIINNELQYYIEPLAFGMSPFSTADGVLRIQASKRKEELAWLTEQQYLSGLLTTKGHFSQKYGRFEIRARVPKGQGLWPAFWMLPSHDEWPSGVDILPELDVMEYLGHEGASYHTTLHSNDSGESVADGSSHDTDSMLYEDFHVYSAVWNETKVAWYFDYKKIFETNAPEDFDHPKHLLLNLAVGGDWAGAPDDETQFPAHFEVDYLRTYQFDGSEDFSDGANGTSTEQDGLERLAPPINFHGIVYSDHTAELFWGKREEYDAQTRFELSRDGNAIASNDGTSHFEEGLSPGATYQYELVAQSNGFNDSLPISVSLTMSGNRDD